MNTLAFLLPAIAVCAPDPAPEDSPWVRPGPGQTAPLWGFRSGIQVALWPHGIEGRGTGGPRGLFRVAYPILDNGRRHGLINYIAVEPIVGRARGFSELEVSASDGKRGRPFWTGPSLGGPPDPGAITREDGIERLRVTVHVERFDNGAQPVVDLTFRADRPDEVVLGVRAAPGSATMRSCVLTATMGNYARLRKLWLLDGVVAPADLWPSFGGTEFTPEAFFPVGRLPRHNSGDLLVCATTDEKDPGAVEVDPRGPGWRYRGSFPVTQYWRKPAGTWTDGLRLRVNGRSTYWAVHTPIPGGLAYENFDFVAPYREGDTFVFGVTRRPPADLGAPTGPRP